MWHLSLDTINPSLIIGFYYWDNYDAFKDFCSHSTQLIDKSSRASTIVIKLCIFSHLKIFDIFNVEHLTPFYRDSFDNDMISNSIVNFLRPEENDARTKEQF